MGKLSIEHPLVFDYIPEVVEAWNTLTQEQKDTFNAFGEPYGYTGMNVLLISIELWGTLHLGGADTDKFYFQRIE